MSRNSGSYCRLFAAMPLPRGCYSAVIAKRLRAMTNHALLIDSPSHHPAQMDPAALAEAFRLFNEASSELSRAYDGLQTQVAQLTVELAQANGELRRQYQEKAALNERLGTLLAALPAGVVVLDGAGSVDQANPAAMAMLGSDIVGWRWQELQSVRLIASDAANEWTNASGLRLEMRETSLDSSGGRIVLLHDVTEAQRMRALAARNERLAAMGEMVAGLAHQLRTPLSAALLYAANFGSPALPAPDRERVASRVVERLQHLEALIRDMLVFARGEIGSRHLMTIDELVGQVSANCDPIARDKGVEFLALAESGNAAVWVSRTDLVGALINLIENAIGAMPAGGIVALDAEVDATNVTFCICDNGPGIAPALQKRLFEPFFTTRAQGTGLGLAIARGVARAHGGDLELHPGRETRGQRWATEFRLSLPRAAEAKTGNKTESGGY